MKALGVAAVLALLAIGLLMIALAAWQVVSYARCQADPSYSGWFCQEVIHE